MLASHGLYVEIQTFGMAPYSDDCELLAAAHEPPVQASSFDVVVTLRCDATGEVSILEEYDGLSDEDAAEIERDLEKKYAVIACEAV
jgi:hypothetical protein